MAGLVFRRLSKLGRNIDLDEFVVDHFSGVKERFVLLLLSFLVPLSSLDLLEV